MEAHTDKTGYAFKQKFVLRGVARLFGDTKSSYENENIEKIHNKKENLYEH